MKGRIGSYHGCRYGPYVYLCDRKSFFHNFDCLHKLRYSMAIIYLEAKQKNNLTASHLPV